MRIFYSINHSGCAYWRSREPARMMEKLGLAETICFSQEETSKEDMEDIIQWAHVIAGQSAAGIQSVALMLKFKEIGKRTIMDYDDLVYSCSPFNPAYKTLGIREVKAKDDKGEEFYLWRDGENGFSLKDNTFRYNSQQDILQIADVITTTTEYLRKQYITDMNVDPKKIKVLPNSIDFDIFKPFEKKRNNKIRIGWTPSASHFAEIFLVRDMLTKLFEKYGNSIEVVILGDLLDLKEHFKDKIEYHQFVDLAIYPLKLAALNLDIGICPLVDNEFNKCKSQLKWTEFSALGLPCVTTDIEPYQCIEQGVTGYKAKNIDQWVEMIGSLIENEKLRKDIASNAYDKNYSDFNLEKNASMWVKAYEL